MKEINLNNNQTKKIQIRSYSTIEQFKEELKQYYSLNELYLSIKQQRLLGSQFMELITSSFDQLNHLQQLTFKADNKYFIDLSPLFLALKKLKNLEYLSLMLLENWFINDKSEITLGEGLEDLGNLKTLKICFTQPSNQDLKLLNAFQKLMNLTTLSVQMRQLKNGKHKGNQQNLFKGLRYLKNLISLELMFDNRLQNTGQYLSTLIDELNEMKNLKNFNFLNDDGNECNYLVIQSILQLENLEKLEMNYLRGFESVQCCLEGIVRLKNLKHLKLRVSEEIANFECTQKHLNVISKLNSLDYLDLDIGYIQIENQAFSLNFINQIQNITELQLSFGRNHQNLIDLLIILQNQKKLKKLTIDYSDDQEQEVDIDSSLIQKCYQFLLKLECFKLIVVSTELKKLFFPFWGQLLNGLVQIQTIDWKKGWFDPYKIVYFKQNDQIYDSQDSQNILKQVCERNNKEFIYWLNQLSIQKNLHFLSLIAHKQILFSDDFFQELRSFNYCNLTYLLLNSKGKNDFSLQGIEQLNLALKLFSNLTALDLALKRIHLPNKCIEILFESIKYLKSLKQLKLKYLLQIQNDEGICGVVEFPQSVKQLELKIKFYKKNYDYYYNDIKNIILGLNCLKDLRGLLFKMNIMISEQAEFQEMFQVFINLSSLETIFIDFWKFDTLNGINKLFSYLKLLQNVKIYISEYCNIEFSKQNDIEESMLPSYQIDKEDDIELKMQEKTFLMRFAQKVIENSKLSSLNLQTNAWIPEYIVNFLSSFKSQIYLKKLNILLEDIDNENAMCWLDQLGFQMQNLPNLEVLILDLNLKDNNFIQITQLYKNFYLLQNLKSFTINLNYCYSTDEINIILENLKELKLLNFLGLSFYRIQNISNIYLFNSGEFINLNSLKLYTNTNFNYGKQFYKSLDKLKHLRVVIIDKNIENIRQISKIKRLVMIIQYN